MFVFSEVGRPWVMSFHERPVLSTLFQQMWTSFRLIYQKISQPGSSNICWSIYHRNQMKEAKEIQQRCHQRSGLSQQHKWKDPRFLVIACISYYTHLKMGDEITYLLPNFNGAKISNFTPHFTGMWLLIHAGVKANPCARGPVYVYLVQGAPVIWKSSGWFQDVCYTVVFHRGEAMYISLIGFQWTSTAIKSFQ